MVKTTLFTQCSSFWFNAYFFECSFKKQKKFIIQNQYFSNFLKNESFVFCGFFWTFSDLSKFNFWKQNFKKKNFLFFFKKKKRICPKKVKIFSKTSIFLNNFFVFFFFLWYNIWRVFKFFSVFKNRFQKYQLLVFWRKAIFFIKKFFADFLNIPFFPEKEKENIVF